MRLKCAVGSMLAISLASCAPDADSEEEVLAVAA